MSLFDLIPSPYRLVAEGAGLLFVVAALAGAVYHYGNQREDYGYARGHAEYTGLRAEMNAAALAAQEKARTEESRRQAAQQEIENAHQLELQHARADAATADAAAGRLRVRVEELIAAARRGDPTGNPSPIPGGPSADDATGMLADLLGRCVSRIRFLAATADERGAAGVACQREYDSLSPSASSPQ